MSSEKGYLETVCTLLEYGADVGDTDKVRNQMMMMMMMMMMMIMMIAIIINNDRIIIIYEDRDDCR